MAIVVAHWQLRGTDLVDLVGVDVNLQDVTAVGVYAGCRHYADGAKSDHCTLHRVASLGWLTGSPRAGSRVHMTAERVALIRRTSTEGGISAGMGMFSTHSGGLSARCHQPQHDHELVRNCSPSDVSGPGRRGSSEL